MSSQRRHGSRKFDTWTFRDEGPNHQKMSIEFEVMALANDTFEISTKDIPKERFSTQAHEVVGELRKKAQAAAEAEFDLRMGLSWSPWLEVRIQKISDYDTKKTVNAAQAHVTYSVIPRGEGPDGRAYTRSENSGVIVDFPHDVGVCNEENDLGRMKPGFDPEKAKSRTGQNLHYMLNMTDHRDKDTQFTYLPDTPENRAGLDAIINAIETINQRLQAFLNPEQISQTLLRAAKTGLPLLAGPEETPERKSSPRPRG